MNIEKHRAFIESLEGAKGLPEEMHGWRFRDSLLDIQISLGTQMTPVEMFYQAHYLIERCRRAESRQIPDLKEKVKELVRDAMDAVRRRYVFDEEEARDAFRALCAPEKGSKEVRP